MALRCLMALRNSDSRSGCRNVEPACSSSERSRIRFDITVRSRPASTPGFAWNSFERGELPLELLQHIRADVAAGG